MSEVPKTKAV